MSILSQATGMLRVVGGRIASFCKPVSGFAKLNSIKVKASLLYTVVLAVILVVFSAVLFGILSFHLYQDIDTNLKVKARETQGTIRAYADVAGGKPGALDFAVRKAFFLPTDYPIRIFDAGKIKRLDGKWQERADVMGLNENYVAFISMDHRSIITSHNFPPRLLPAFLELSKWSMDHPGLIFSNISYKKGPLRVITVPYVAAGRTYVLQVGVSQKPVIELLHSLVQAVACVIPLVLVLTSFVGRIFARRILDPIEEIAQTANAITHEDLTSRVKTRHADTEIKYLTDSFNDMIRRLEGSFQHINDFSSQVAHELKTPLAIMIGESELALNRQREPEEYRSALQINLEEAQRMRRTVEDLLLLARLDYQPDAFKFQTFDAVEFFREICAQAQMLAAEKGLTVTFFIPDQPVMIHGDRLHLRRLFFNLIDNAMKFTPAPGEIRLHAVRRGRKLVVSVSDTGVGIPPEDLPKIFEKFYHVDRTAQSTSFGNGLGLNIVQAIVNIHRGKILVRSHVGKGTTFQIILPVGSQISID